MEMPAFGRGYRSDDRIAGATDNRDVDFITVKALFLGETLCNQPSLVTKNLAMFAFYLKTPFGRDELAVAGAATARQVPCLRRESSSESTTADHSAY
eukprot:scaffold15016_cov19-Prasinocladus_malaysianus.AAC.3